MREDVGGRDCALLIILCRNVPGEGRKTTTALVKVAGILPEI